MRINSLYYTNSYVQIDLTDNIKKKKSDAKEYTIQFLLFKALKQIKQVFAVRTQDSPRYPWKLYSN